MHLCAIFLKEKLSSMVCLIASNICWGIVIYPVYTVHWLLLQAWRRTTPIFYTATDSVTDLAITEHVGNTQQDAMLPSQVLSVAPTWSYWQWRVVQLWPGDILTVFRVFLVKKHAAFKWKKNTISGFSVSPGSAEALIRWGGKMKYILIAWFLGNISAKNCRSRTVYVKMTASRRWNVFLRHSVDTDIMRLLIACRQCIALT